MAGQQRQGARQAERSSRAASSSGRSGAASAVASGSATVISTPASPESTAEQPIQSTYRKLIMRGLTPDEAANLTAFLSGIAVGDTHWTIRQVHQLLFLRQMARTGHFSEPTEPAGR